MASDTFATAGDFAGVAGDFFGNMSLEGIDGGMDVDADTDVDGLSSESEAEDLVGAAIEVKPLLDYLALYEYDYIVKAATTPLGNTP